MAKQIIFPSITELYRALMDKKSPHEYVPKLSKAVQKLVDTPSKQHLKAAKNITQNPTIQKLIDAIYVASKTGQSEDIVMDFQFGVIATLLYDEYTQLPWLVDEIKDDKLKYNVLSFYETKYTNPEYIKKYDSKKINQNTRHDYLAKCIIEIELAKLKNPKTSDSEVHTILSNLQKMMALPRFNREKDYLLSSIFDILQAKINQELSSSTPNETKIASVYCLYACEFANLYDDKNYASNIKDKFNFHKIILQHQQKQSSDAYDKIKSGTKKIKQQIHDATSTPQAQAFKQTATAMLDNAARVTVNAIDAGIKKIKSTTTRKNMETATANIKKQWNEFKKNLDNLFDQFKDL